MPSRRRGWTGTRQAAALAMLAATLSLAAVPARAGLLEFLFGNPREPAQPVAPQSVAPQVVRPAGPPPIPQQRTYCVRTCDGYYFAIGFVRNKSELAAHQSMCGSSCGGGAMTLYAAPVQASVSDKTPNAPAIERAVDPAGALYTALPTAYAFRDAPNPACACKSTASGLPQIPISIDPTLRSGDIIVMQDGLKVFRGTSAGPHTDEDFVAAAAAKSLPTNLRQQMLSLESRIAQ